jgi:short-subunit dehydrogenase
MTSSATRHLALVTGASSGIGLELAKQFAQHDFDLIICAEDDELATARAELQALGVQVDAVQTDLTTTEGVDELWARVDAAGRPLDAAALNAGRGQGGAFADQRLDDILAIIDLNVRQTTHLAKHVVDKMVAQEEGRILFTSSIASTQPGAFQAVYNASKSFDQSLAEALREELKDTGVTVTSLMPGPTDTEFFERADMQDTKVAEAATDDPADVAREGFEGLMAGKQQVVGGSPMNALQARAGRLVPDALKAKAHRKMAEPGSRSSD